MFPDVYAARRIKTHRGTFGTNKIEFDNLKDNHNIEIKCFNITKEWIELCEFFDGWTELEQSKAHSKRFNLFKKNNYIILHKGEGSIV